MEDVTKEDFESISHLEAIWEGYKMSGSLSISHTDKILIDNVYKKIFKLKTLKGYCYTCDNATIAAFTKTFGHYDLFKERELLSTTTKLKRQRL